MITLAPGPLSKNSFSVLQEEQNRGKPNWEHLNDELHVLITVEDTENRAQMKMQRAIEEVKKLLVVVSHHQRYLRNLRRVYKVMQGYSLSSAVEIYVSHECPP
jgi:c-di-AMP phosphodiesterase-like protein